MNDVAKELGKSPRELLTWLADNGEFVKSATSSIESPVIRRLREAFPQAPDPDQPSQPDDRRLFAAQHAAPTTLSPEMGFRPDPPPPGRIPTSRRIAQNERPEVEAPATSITAISAWAEPGHRVFRDGDTGVSYGRLLAPFIVGASEILVTDPYLRSFEQIRNLVEFLGVVARSNLNGAQMSVKLLTSVASEPNAAYKQMELLNRTTKSVKAAGIALSYDFDSTIHDRSILTDTGWKILLGRGLDIFKPYPSGPLELCTRVQELRKVRSFEVTYVRRDPAQRDGASILPRSPVPEQERLPPPGSASPPST